MGSANSERPLFRLFSRLVEQGALEEAVEKFKKDFPEKRFNGQYLPEHKVGLLLASLGDTEVLPTESFWATISGVESHPNNMSLQMPVLRYRNFKGRKFAYLIIRPEYSSKNLDSATKEIVAREMKSIADYFIETINGQSNINRKEK